MNGCLPTWLYRGLDESKIFEGLGKNDLNKLEVEGWRDCQIKAREYYYEHQFDKEKKENKLRSKARFWENLTNAKR